MKRVFFAIALAITVFAFAAPKAAATEKVAEDPYFIPCGAIVDGPDGTIRPCRNWVEVPYLHCSLHGGKTYVPYN